MMSLSGFGSTFYHPCTKRWKSRNPYTLNFIFAIMVSEFILNEKCFWNFDHQSLFQSFWSTEITLNSYDVIYTYMLPYSFLISSHPYNSKLNAAKCKTQTFKLFLTTFSGLAGSVYLPSRLLQAIVLLNVLNV